jgi:hypothetical protein
MKLRNEQRLAPWGSYLCRYDLLTATPVGWMKAKDHDVLFNLNHPCNKQWYASQHQQMYLRVHRQKIELRLRYGAVVAEECTATSNLSPEDVQVEGEYNFMLVPLLDKEPERVYHGEGDVENAFDLVDWGEINRVVKAKGSAANGITSR